MSRDKQIEEMARDLENHTCMSQFQAEIASRMLYIKGYRKASEVAEEIFRELLNEIDKAIDFTADSRRIRFELCQQKDIDPYKDRFFNVCDGKYNCVLGLGKYIAELKKKYESEKDNGGI